MNTIHSFRYMGMMSQGTGSQSLRRQHRSSAAIDNDGTLSMSRYVGDTEWEAKEALRQRELEEARARAAQMEKTMRWWSDCTANWREKWSKVRNERNKAREEVKILRTKLDNATKETTSYKREKIDLENQNDELKKEMEKIHLLLIKHAGQWDQKIFEALEMSEGSERDLEVQKISETSFTFDSFKTALEQEASTSGKETEADSLSSKGERLSEARVSPEYNISDRRTKRTNSLKDEMSPYDEDYLLQKLSMLQLRLEEATKTLQVEREEKTVLHRSLEKLQVELQEQRDKCEDLKLSKQETVRELLTLQDQHRDTVQQIQSDLQEETSSRENVDRRMADLRAELERLQAENASEWGKRERLETEKLALERDNKKLKCEVRDLQERIERRGHPSPSSDSELRGLQQELADRTKELTDLKHSHAKIKKSIQDKTTELAHGARRAEQYEAEVKRLRSRVEELKRELAVAEDEVDSATNNIRKLQRTNDELQEQVEGLQVQLEHLHSRLRSNNTTSLLSHRKQSPLLTEDVSDEEISEYSQSWKCKK